MIEIGINFTLDIEDDNLTNEDCESNSGIRYWAKDENVPRVGENIYIGRSSMDKYNIYLGRWRVYKVERQINFTYKDDSFESGLIEIYVTKEGIYDN